MNLTLLDWTVIALYFLFNLGIGLYYARRARGSTSEFFLSGRDVPWWLAGTSMVATTFAADTPLLVTGLVAKNGIAGNWLWWNMVMSGMMTVFFYARLWRRAGVMTDIEFAELRYSGKPAAFLRGFRALYLGIPINCIILGWVNLAMIKILQETLRFDQLATGTAWAGFSRHFAVDAPVSLLILIGMLLFTAYYTTISGLWGVLVTDLFQFVLKMGMVILLAIFAVNAVGGIDALKSKVTALDAASGQAGSRLDFFPPLDSAWMPVITLCVYLAVNWWATWYPGAEPGGGGYVAQRIFSAKNERHGVLATLWFNVAHYALRPWPWILHGAGDDRALSRSGRQRSRLHQSADGPGRVSHLAARLHDRRLRGRLHVDDRHAAELGRIVRDQRFLSPLPRARRQRAALRDRVASRDGAADGAFADRHVLSCRRSNTPGSC